MNQDLRAFYEQKHAAERLGPEPPGTLTATPHNRYEAAVHYLHRFFRGGSILEVGAGLGHLARSLVAAGIDFDRYMLSEVSTVALKELATEDTRFEVRQVDAENVPENLGKFDCVLMVALIEHLLDPIGSMSRIRRLLNPGGFVYLDTPNVAKYTRRIKLAFGRFPSTASRNEGLTTYDGKPVGLHDQGHLHYFTFRSLSLMLVARCGFSRVVQAPYSLDPWMPRRLGHALARLQPTVFSELALLAYA